MGDCHGCRDFELEGKNLEAITMTSMTENQGHAAALAAYTAGLASCFGISHIAPIHNFLHRHSPTFYPYLNVILPCGRAIFLLLLAERGARIFEQSEQPRQ
jgi:hypothetical protein